MTTAEFDEQFFYGKLCILHESMEEWNVITRYAVLLGADEQPFSINHNCHVYSYAFVDPGTYRMNASQTTRNRDCISFAEFQSITSDDRAEIPSMNLDDVL